MPRKPSCECGTCPKCRKRIYMRRFYAENPEQLKKARQRARDNLKDPVKAEVIRARDRARRPRTTPIGGSSGPKVLARNTLTSAISRGLEREPCLFCDNPRSDAHHHDYTKPLEVTWLCRKHHLIAHNGHSGLSMDDRLEIKRLDMQGVPRAQIARQFGVHFNTVYRSLKRMGR